MIINPIEAPKYVNYYKSLRLEFVYLCRNFYNRHQFLAITLQLNGSGSRIPIAATLIRVGRCSPFGTRKSHFCTKLAMNRNNSIRAIDSPRQERFPIENGNTLSDLINFPLLASINRSGRKQSGSSK